MNEEGQPEGGAQAPPEGFKIGDYVSPFKTLPWSKVAIIGYAPSCKLVPWDDSDMCRAGLNDLYIVPGMAGDGPDGNGLNYQVWFQQHSEADLNQRSAGHKEWLSRPKDFPVFMQKQFDWAPSSIKYPLQTVFDTFPDGIYQTNSISYMICWALLESKKFRPDGFEEIYLYGIDMATSDAMDPNAEFAAQRPSVEYFIGLARGYGIQVHVPTQADIMKAGRLYGYEGSFTIQTKLRNRIAGLKERRALAEKQLEQSKAMLWSCEGSIQDAEHWLGNWTWDVSDDQEWAAEAISKHGYLGEEEVEESVIS